MICARSLTRNFSERVMPATAEAADAATQATDAFSTKLEENKLSEGQERGPDEEEDDDDEDEDA